MILTKTPLRISLVGGGTDLPDFYEKHGGAVVSFTIDKYVYVAVNKPMENKVRVSYSENENVSLARDVKHELVRACLEKMGIHNQIEIVSISDIPGKGTGLGSSSAFTVGLLNALTQFSILHREKYPVLWDVAETACDIEIKMCGKPIGKQDQYACAYGGLNHLVFNKDGKVDLKRIPMKDDLLEELNSRLMLFYTGITRRSSDILNLQKDTIRTEDNVVYFMEKMRDDAVNLYEELSTGNIHVVGDFLHKNWMRKRQLAPLITDENIDRWYKIARDHGAAGGKLLGAGGGGFMLFYVPKEYQKSVLDNLPLVHIPFKIDKKGTRIAYMKGFSDE